jgi:ATP-dependent Lhr-like helicase
VWELIWAGALTNDTLAPLRARLDGSGRTAHARRPRAPRTRYGRYGGLAGIPTTSASRSGVPYSMSGRWSALPARDDDPTRRALAAADTLLDRYGLVTRGSVAAERISGGFAGVYPVLKAAEESGRARRGYFVDGLGAAQFALPGAVDRLRGQARPSDVREPAPALVLAATDPANPFGAALPWPVAPAPEGGGRGHQPARKAGALVVLLDGVCVLYVERGGRSLLSFTDDPAVLQPAADALALAVRDGALGKLAVERADGVPIVASPLGEALASAGFRPTPRGLRLRG